MARATLKVRVGRRSQVRLSAISPSRPATAPDSQQVVAMKHTLGGTGTGGTLNQQARDLIAQASKQFDDAQTALQAGDFAEYGRQIEALQQTLRDLQALQ